MRVPFHITTAETWDGTPSTAVVNGTNRPVVSTAQDGSTITIVLGGLSCTDVTGSDTVVFDVGLGTPSRREQLTVPLTYGWASVAAAGAVGGLPLMTANAATKFITADPVTRAFHEAVVPGLDRNTLRLNAIATDADVDVEGHSIVNVGNVTAEGSLLGSYGLTGAPTTLGRLLVEHPASSVGVGLDVIARTRHLRSDGAEIQPRGLTSSGTYALLEARTTRTSGGTSFIALGDEDIVLGSRGANAANALLFIRDTALDPSTNRSHVAKVSYGGDWIATSDRRTKEDIRPLDDDPDALLEALAALRVCSFARRRSGSGRQVGLIADDHVDTPLEHLIDLDGDLRGVNTTALLMHLLRGVQALIKRTERQASREE